ncbi:hypothetical protein J132_09125, partial [Termitomyces sp. J132]
KSVEFALVGTANKELAHLRRFGQSMSRPSLPETFDDLEECNEVHPAALAHLIGVLRLCLFEEGGRPAEERAEVEAHWPFDDMDEGKYM